MSVLEDLGDAIRPEGVGLLDVVVAVALIGLAFPASRLVERLVARAARRVRALSPDTVDLIGRVGRYLTLFVAAALALNLVGVNVGWAVAIALIFLFLIVLTLRPLVENSAAGFVLRSRPSFAIGDEIGLLGHVGEVLEITARTTVLKTRDGRRIHIPNTDVLDQPIVVYTAFEARRASIDIAFDPGCDLEGTTAVLLGAVAAAPGVRPDPNPSVSAESFGSGAIEVAVQFWFSPDLQSEALVTDAAIRSINEALREANIEPMPPRLRVETTGTTGD